MWILQSVKPALTFRVQPGTTKTLGRGPRADFVLEAPLVSRLQCQFEAGDDTLDVVDLKSTNGTFVNDQRVKRARLTVGDRLRIGRVELVVSSVAGSDGGQTPV